MKHHKSKIDFQIAILISWLSQMAIAVPIISGEGQGSSGATGSFGATGNIFEYRLQTSMGVQFLETQTAGTDFLLLSYRYMAAAAVSSLTSQVYLDADINQYANTWANERGESSVSAGGATTWEIDEPGFGFDYSGNIFANFENLAFDNTIFGGQPDRIDDVALGLGFIFTELSQGDELLFEVLLSESSIGTGWGTVLHQWDGDDGLAGDNLYLAGRYSIQRPPPVDPAPGAVPEPGTWALMGLGIVALTMRGKKRQNHS